MSGTKRKRPRPESLERHVEQPSPESCSPSTYAEPKSRSTNTVFVVSTLVPLLPSAPTDQHTKADAYENCSGELLAVANRNESGRLVADFNHAHGNDPYASTTAPAFASGTGLAHATSARSRPGAV